MKIEKILPCGFCYGVMHSYQASLEIIRTHPHHTIYMLGWLVHNLRVINEFKQPNVIIIDDKFHNRFELIRDLEIRAPAVLILSAHGTDYKTIALAKQRGLEVYDFTCKFVYKTHEIIKLKLQQNYHILFIGKQNHPETKAILAINQKIQLISSLDDLLKIKLDQQSKYFCTNQTTYNMLELDEIIATLQIKGINIEFQNDICNATRLRQQAILKMSDNIDVCLILGDVSSSNANELLKFAKTKTQAYMINDIQDIQLSWFENKQFCAIAAAASTPANLIDEVFEFLCEKFN